MDYTDNNKTETDVKFRSLRSESFIKELSKLPENVQELAKTNFKKWKEDPRTVGFKPLNISNGNVYSAQIGNGHRALAQKTKDKNGVTAYLWFWAGTHEAYNTKIKNLAEFKKKSNTLLENLISKDKKRTYVP